MIRLLALGVLLLAAPVALSAQPVPAQLTLDDALALARQQHPALRKARQDREAAGANTLQALGQMLPAASASLSFTGSSSTTLTGLDEFGRPVRLDRAATSESSRTSQGIALSLPVFDAGMRLREHSAARSEERVRDARLAGEELRVAAAVQRAFYQAMRMEQQIELEQRLLAAARDNLERTELLMRVAASDHADLLGARIQVTSAEQAVGRAVAEAAKARLQLLDAIGIGGAPDFVLVGELPAAFDPAVLDLEALVERATAGSPTVLQARAAATAAGNRAAATRARRWPTINANAGFSRGMNMLGYGAFFDLNPRDYGFNFGLSASLPLFTGFQTRSQIVAAATAEHAAREDERAAEQAAGRDVRTAWFDLESAYHVLRHARARVELERERLAMAEEQYRQGALSFVLLQQYIEQAAQAERQTLEARFGYASALVTLEERAGGTLER